MRLPEARLDKLAGLLGFPPVGTKAQIVPLFFRERRPTLAHMLHQKESGGCAAGALQAPNQPAFVRLPRPGQRESLTGLTRTAIFGLLKAGKVRSVSLKQPGCKRGVRLVDAASLVAAIEREAA